MGKPIFNNEPVTPITAEEMRAIVARGKLTILEKAKAEAMQNLVWAERDGRASASVSLPPPRTEASMAIEKELVAWLKSLGYGVTEHVWSDYWSCAFYWDEAAYQQYLKDLEEEYKPRA